MHCIRPWPASGYPSGSRHTLRAGNSSPSPPRYCRPPQYPQRIPHPSAIRPPAPYWSHYPQPAVSYTPAAYQELLSCLYPVGSCSPDGSWNQASPWICCLLLLHCLPQYCHSSDPRSASRSSAQGLCRVYGSSSYSSAFQMVQTYAPGSSRSFRSRCLQPQTDRIHNHPLPPSVPWLTLVSCLRPLYTGRHCFPSAIEPDSASQDHCTLHSASILRDPARMWYSSYLLWEGSLHALPRHR